MAENTIKKLEEQLNCAICLETYKDPKLLQCFHIYCRDCLERLVVRDQQGQLSLTCPTCRQATPIPANGVTGLQSPFQINRLLEILEQHKMAKDTAPDPSKFLTTGVGFEVAVVGEKSTVFLQAIDSDGDPYMKLISSLQCELVSEVTGVVEKGNIEHKGRDQYEISYQPTIKGKHQLSIKVEDTHIRGSPFAAVAIKKLGTPIRSITGLDRPGGMAINQKGEVVVTENNCVSVISPSGEKLLTFGTRGSGQGEVAVDGGGNILVVDCCNHRIQKFTANDQFLSAVGTQGEGPLQFSFPCGIAFNAANNKVYVIDTMNNRVQVLNSDLSFYHVFGEKGSGEGQFRYPWDIACDSSGNVYVVDSDNDHIQVFTAEGQFCRMFGKQQGCGKGIAIDTNDVVYVSEFVNDRVSVFTSKGQFITSFGQRGEGPGQYSLSLLMVYVWIVMELCMCVIMVTIVFKYFDLCELNLIFLEYLCCSV